jgi:plasmid replication initiation protein
MTDLTNRNYFRQAPSVIGGRYSLSKSEGDLVYALLTTIDKYDEDFKDYVFTKKQLETKLGIQIHTSQLRATAKSLMSKILEVVRDEEDWELLSWFSYFSYKNNTITCRFDKAMKPFLLELQQYVLADFKQIIQIQSEYSRRIYFLLKEYMKFGTRKFNVDELMEVLQVPKSYKNYADFKRKVLNQAVKDINKYTDIEIKNLGTAKKPIYFEEIKPSRKVEEVVFHFKKNHNDIKMFIDYIRELHTNQALYENKEGRMIKCSEKGLLYYADKPNNFIDKDKAMKIWEWLHEHRESLYIHQDDLFTLQQAEEQLKKETKCNS